MKKILLSSVLLLAASASAAYEIAPVGTPAIGAGYTAAVVPESGSFSLNPALVPAGLRLGLDTSLNSADSASGAVLGQNENLYGSMELARLGSAKGKAPGNLGFFANFFHLGMGYEGFKADWTELMVKVAYSIDVLSPVAAPAASSELRVGISGSFGLLAGGDGVVNAGDAALNGDVDVGAAARFGELRLGLAGNNLIRMNPSFSRTATFGLGYELGRHLKFGLTPVVEGSWLFDFNRFDLRFGLRTAFHPQLDIRAGFAWNDNFSVGIPTAGIGWRFGAFKVGYTFAYNLKVGGIGDHNLALALAVD